VQKSAWLTRAIVLVVLLVLAAVAIVAFAAPAAAPSDSPALGSSPAGVLQGAGLLFFAFAGYARIATLAEEVRDPAKTIPRAIAVALAITLGVYAIIAVAAMRQLGVEGLAASTGALEDVVRAAGAPGLAGVVRLGAAVAALGSLLALILGVSRTTLAMARDGHLPASLAAVHPRSQVPRHAEVVVGLVVAVVAATVDVRSAIGFSSFGVLIYYAIANASALTLLPVQAWAKQSVPLVGLFGCLLVAFSLPHTAVAWGLVVMFLGTLAYTRVRRQREHVVDHGPPP
jgi:basic amino acid/polyamine antiporter, APA family